MDAMCQEVGAGTEAPMPGALQKLLYVPLPTAVHLCSL